MDQDPHTQDPVSQALHTQDLQERLRGVATREDLAALLREVHVRADSPSLRTLDARTAHAKVRLTKSTVADMLAGRRFPRKAVLETFLRACGVTSGEVTPWARTWERIAAVEKPRPTADPTEVQRLREQLVELQTELAEAEHARARELAEAREQAERRIAEAEQRAKQSEAELAKVRERFERRIAEAEQRLSEREAELTAALELSERRATEAEQRAEQDEARQQATPGYPVREDDSSQQRSEPSPPPYGELYGGLSPYGEPYGRSPYGGSGYRPVREDDSSQPPPADVAKPYGGSTSYGQPPGYPAYEGSTSYGQPPAYEGQREYGGPTSYGSPPSYGGREYEGPPYVPPQPGYPVGEEPADRTAHRADQAQPAVVQPPRPEFDVVVRGYRRDEVDDYLQTLLDAPLPSAAAIPPRPDFEIAMRGYDRRQVDEYLAALHAARRS